MIQRKCVIAYFENKNVLEANAIKDNGTVYYVSDKNKFAYIYCDQNRYKALCDALSKMEGITSYEDSLNGVENHTF